MFSVKRKKETKLKKWIIRIIPVCIMLAFVSVARSQDYVFNHLSKSDGLASNMIHCTWQDRQGFLWIGTDNGLQRYDGRSFFSPNINTNTTLPFAAVNQILEDKKGRIWIRCGNIVGIFNPGNFQFRVATINTPQGSTIGEDLRLKLDINGQLYLVPKFNPLLYFDDASFSFDEKYTPYKLPKGAKISITFEDTVLRRTWLGLNNRLACYDWKSKQLWYKDNNPLNIPILKDSFSIVSSFDIDKDRKYWFTLWQSKQAFFCFDERTNRYSADTAGLTKNEEKGYYELRYVRTFSDSIRIAYGINTFQVFVNNRFEHIEDHAPPGSLIYETVSQVFEDREGIIWVATDNGLYSLTTDARKTARILVPKKQGTVFNAACQLPDGDILLNRFGQGIVRFDEKLSEQRPGVIRSTHADPNFLRSWTIYSNLTDSTVWIGCQYGHLMVYEFKTGKLNYYQPAPFRRGTTTKILADDKGYLWIGLSNGDILRWKQHSNMNDTSFKLMNNVSMAVTEMFFHTDGNLYIGTRGAGVFAISGTTGKTVQQFTTTSAIKLSSNHIGDLCRVNDSVVCFTGDVPNIVNLRSGNVTQLTRYNDELIGEPFVQIKDKYDDIWFITMNGFYRYRYDPGYVQKFTQWEGLSLPSSSIAVFERQRMRNGDILLSGNLNAMLFDPGNYRSLDKPSNVLISNFRIGNIFMPLDSLLNRKTIHLERDQNSLSVSFAIPGFGKRNRYQYQYQLEGVDKDWIKAGDVREASYSLLPPGTYIFRVRAQNEEGVFSAETTSLKIVIHPPFWKTWWFISLIALTLAAIFYQLHRMRIQQLLKVEKVRSRLASDLHDDMGSTLSTINILSSIAINKVNKDNPDVSNHLKNISQSSSRVMEAMDDIVWSINPGNDTMQKVTARMREFAGHTLEAKDIDFVFSVDEEVKELRFDMESRKDIFLLFKEAINNIVKYAEADSVKISLELQRKTFIMRIRDDGKGFDTAAPLGETRGNGLRNMKARAEALNGELNINSKPGEGTTIELKVAVKTKWIK